jgi:hypothetical protein
MSMPAFFKLVTEWSVGGAPARAETPAESTLSERSGSGCAARAWRNKPAAIGLRQMLAVQITKTCAGAGIKTGKGT